MGGGRGLSVVFDVRTGGSPRVVFKERSSGPSKWKFIESIVLTTERTW